MDIQLTTIFHCYSIFEKNPEHIINYRWNFKFSADCDNNFHCNFNRKKSEYGIKTVNWILYVYEFDSLKSKANYELKILERDSVKIFKYYNLKDSTRNMSFRFDKLNSNLYFGSDKFNILESNHYCTELNFDKYELAEPVMDGVDPILFNKTYGVLAWDNNWGNQFYFVNEVNIDRIDLPIFKYNVE